MTTVEGTKASLAIAADFRARIARGELHEGEALPVEADLVHALGVSKSVVREALRILETEGLVEVRRGVGGGPRVRHPSISQAAMGMGVYLQIGDVAVTDVWETRDRIIGGAVERLAARPGAYDLGELDDAVAALGAALGEFHVSRHAFHPHLVAVGETAVHATRSKTEHMVVVSLRHVIATEFTAATQALTDPAEAEVGLGEIVDAWTQVARHVRRGHLRAARKAYDHQAARVREGLWHEISHLTVGELVTAAPR